MEWQIKSFTRKVSKQRKLNLTSGKADLQSRLPSFLMGAHSEQWNCERAKNTKVIQEWLYSMAVRLSCLQVPTILHPNASSDTSQKYKTVPCLQNFAQWVVYRYLCMITYWRGTYQTTPVCHEFKYLYAQQTETKYSTSWSSHLISQWKSAMSWQRLSEIKASQLC